MTCIAFKDGVLATDSGLWRDDILVGRTDKIVRAPDGTLAAAAGTCFLVDDFYRWVFEGCIDHWEVPPHDPEKHEFGGLIISPDGEPRYINLQGMTHSTADEEATAIGFGREFMLGIMATGAGAQTAVEAACERVAYCAGPVNVASTRRRVIEPLRKIMRVDPAMIDKNWTNWAI